MSCWFIRVSRVHVSLLRGVPQSHMNVLVRYDEPKAGVFKVSHRWLSFNLAEITVWLTLHT